MLRFTARVALLGGVGLHPYVACIRGSFVVGTRGRVNKTGSRLSDAARWSPLCILARSALSSFARASVCSLSCYISLSLSLCLQPHRLLLHHLLRALHSLHARHARRVLLACLLQPPIPTMVVASWSVCVSPPQQRHCSQTRQQAEHRGVHRRLSSHLIPHSRLLVCTCVYYAASIALKHWCHSLLLSRCRWHRACGTCLALEHWCHSLLPSRCRWRRASRTSLALQHLRHSLLPSRCSCHRASRTGLALEHQCHSLLPSKCRCTVLRA